MSKAKDFVEKNMIYTGKDDSELAKSIAKYNEEVAAANQHLEAAYIVLKDVVSKSSSTILRTLSRRGNMKPVYLSVAAKIDKLVQKIISSI